MFQFPLQQFTFDYNNHRRQMIENLETLSKFLDEQEKRRQSFTKRISIKKLQNELFKAINKSQYELIIQLLQENPESDLNFSHLPIPMNTFVFDAIMEGIKDWDFTQCIIFNFTSCGFTDEMFERFVDTYLKKLTNNNIAIFLKNNELTSKSLDTLIELLDNNGLLCINLRKNKFTLEDKQKIAAVLKNKNHIHLF